MLERQVSESLTLKEEKQTLDEQFKELQVSTADLLQKKVIFPRNFCLLFRGQPCLSCKANFKKRQNKSRIWLPRKLN
jgi:hypothetical protein